MRHHLAMAVAAVCLAVVAAQAPAAPEPALASQAWEFDFTYGHPQVIAVRALDGSVGWYWYIPYKVVNNTGTERLFVPQIDIFTDAGDIITSGRNIPTAVFRAIKERERNPLLETPIEIVGRILQGEDHARESVVVWRASAHDVDAFEVFVSGLSGETAVVMDPVTGQPMLDADSGSPMLDPDTGAPVIDPTTGQPMKDPATQSPVLLRKTLMIRFAAPGTTPTPRDTEVLDEGTTWIMR